MDRVVAQPLTPRRACVEPLELLPPIRLVRPPILGLLAGGAGPVEIDEQPNRGLAGGRIGVGARRLEMGSSLCGRSGPGLMEQRGRSDLGDRLDLLPSGAGGFRPCEISWAP